MQQEHKRKQFRIVPPVIVDGHVLTEEMQDAFSAWRLANGRNWRRKLIDLWDSGKDTGPLRMIRNTLGPSGIYKIK